MKKKLYSLATAILCCLSGWAQEPKGSVPEGGKSYYIYNVSTGKWLNHGYGIDNRQFGVDDNGYLAGLEANDDGFSIKTIRHPYNWWEEDGVGATGYNQLYAGWLSEKYCIDAGDWDRGIINPEAVDDEGHYYLKVGTVEYLAAVGNDQNPAVELAGNEDVYIWKFVAPLDRFSSRFKGSQAENGKEYYLYNVKSGLWLNTWGRRWDGPGDFTAVPSRVILEDFDGDPTTEGDFAILTPERNSVEKPVTYYGHNGDDIYADQPDANKMKFAFDNVGGNAYVIRADKHGHRNRRFAYNTNSDHTVVPEFSYEAGADLWLLIPTTTTIAAPAQLCSYGNNSFDVDFSEAAGIEAYKVVEGTEDGTVKFVKIDKLYAGEGCIIRNTGATVGDPITVKASFNATADATNLMKAGDGSTVMNGEYVNYFLSGVDGVPCLVKMNDGGKAIEEGKAYLQLTAAQAQNAAAFRIDFDSKNATAIESVKSASDQKSDARYNVTGQKVGADYKGIVIVNGKKIINK